ncbi:DUF2459 domain-containing protein [Gymnodinialimonas hymeniacidonis]|uniref:DUF2459 domain-containing protein n=1 Tax=Gymnodinialimonas hymeniacidonis TaxID=3126508 RepID=UPI0034C63B53
MRAAVRLVGRLTGAALVILTVYLVAATVGGVLPGRTTELPPGDDVEIGLLFGPIHVDFLLPADEETRTALAFASPAGVPVENTGVAHFIVGWGARDFYTTAGTYADITVSATFRAVTGDESVLRVDVTGPILEGAEYPRLALSQAQYDALLAEITATVGGPSIPGAGFTTTDGFVEAEGRFHILRTCNTWVGRVLRASGVPVGAWTPTPYSLRLSLWRAGLS